MARILALAALLTVAISAPADAQCVALGEPTTITGFHATLTLPGPPEYTNVATGDDPERAEIILLSHQPVCVTDSDGAALAVEVIQLSCERIPAAPPGTPISVSGSLFAAHTGHHHTAVLLQCEAD